uniref:G_PROTEIN_RECEP_F2_4 domain-containing protein n=1 Tax=Syphacia muris TaxID=451379 RepID=A0A0N5AYE7_9BILA
MFIYISCLYQSVLNRTHRNNESAVRCSQPAPGTECFGVNVTYFYVSPDPNILSLLPRYEVISRFPRCWSFLAPLICAITYRPCTVRYGMKSYKPNIEKLELWQLLRWDMCNMALKECSFLLDWGLWPNFLNCSNGLSVTGKGKSKLYANKSCPIGYREDPANFDRLQCLWPLVKSDEIYRDTKPIIDDCYIPCFSSLVSSISTRSDFKMKVLISSTLIGAILLLISIYVIGFSEVWRKNICAYLLGHASLSGFLYYFFWILGFFDAFSRSTMCFDNGGIRRGINDTLGRTVGWCGIQSFFMQSLFFASYFWLCTFFIVSIGRPRIRADHKILIDGRPDWSLRCVLLVLYLIAAVVALPPFWSNKSDNDGLFGVCYIGVVVDTNRLWIFLPVVIATVIAGLITIIILRSQKLKDNECGGGAVDKNEVKMVCIGSCFNRIRNSKQDETETVVAKAAGAERCGDDVITPGQASAVAENEKLLPNDRVISKLSEQGKQKYDNGFTAVPPFFLGLIVLVYILSLMFLLLIHFRSDWNYDFEDEMILKSFRCTLNRTILTGETDWLKDMKSDEMAFLVDPMSRKRLIGSRGVNAPGCDLKPELDERFYTLFLLYIIVPSLPFLAVFVLLVSGFCGTGFNGIEKIRENFNPFVRIISSSTYSVNEKNYRDSSKDELIEMGCLDGHSSSDSSVKLCNNDLLPQRPFSSLDYLNRPYALSSAVSIPSQINSEPVKLEKTKSHVRKLDLKHLAQCRARSGRKNLSLQSNDGSSCSEQLGMLSSQRSLASLSSEIPSIYSHVSSNCPTSYNIESVSQQRDLSSERAMQLQNQTVLPDGLWQQMCHEYSDKVSILVGCLRQAEDEIRRLTGQQQVIEPSALPASSTSLSYNAGQIGPNVCFSPTNCIPANRYLQHCSQCPMFNAYQNDAICRNTSLTSQCSGTHLPENCCRYSSASCTAISSGSCNSPAKNSAVSHVGSDNDSSKKEKLLESGVDGTKDKDNSVDDKSEKSEDSNAFYSDEEDEEEEKLWKEQSAAILQNEQPRTLDSSTSGPVVETQEVNGSNEALHMSSSQLLKKSEFNSESSDSDNEKGRRRIQHYLLPSLKPPTQTADVTNSLQSHRVVTTDSENSSSSSFTTLSTSAASLPQRDTNAVQQVSTSDSQSESAGHRQLFGNSLQLAAVTSRGSVNNPQPTSSTAANSGGIRPVLLTEEQARGLLNLRDQLTGSDLLYYSNRLREEAMRRLNVQVPNVQLRIRRVPRNINRQAEAIREEEEEVPDPFSSSDGPNRTLSPLDESGSGSRVEGSRNSDTKGNNDGG